MKQAFPEAFQSLVVQLKKSTMGGKELSKDLRDKVVDRHKSGDGKKILRLYQCLEAQWSLLLRSGRYLVQHRPSLGQDVAPNWMKEPGGNWSEKLPRGLQQLWSSCRNSWQRVVIVCMWQQHHKFSTNVACMGGLQEKSHSSRKATCSHDFEDSKATWKKVLWSDETKTICLAKIQYSSPSK